MTSNATPVIVLAAVPDLFFATRLASIAARANATLVVAKTEAEFSTELASRLPALVLVDLSARPFDPISLVRHAKQAGAPRVVAFGPHKDLAARSAALEAGADQWITNQRLSEMFGELLRDVSTADEGRPI